MAGIHTRLTPFQRFAFLPQPNSEGIEVIDGQLLFVTKRWKSLHILDLDRGTYHNVTTRSGLFAGQPDQIERIFESTTQQQHIYFTEDGDKFAGIHARTADGQTLTIVESPNHSDETTGLSFSPDGQFMYFAYQDEGILFEVKRLDGLPFHADVLDVKYHNT
jgi:sugar lactone lactonase YvrE